METGTEIMNTAEGKKERKASTTYAIKQLKGTIHKMEITKMATETELRELKRIHKAILNRWIGLELGE